MILIKSNLVQLMDKVSIIPNDIKMAFASTANEITYVIKNELDTAYGNTFSEANVDIYHDGDTITLDITGFNDRHLMNASGLTPEDLKQRLMDMIDSILEKNLRSIEFLE